MKNENSRAVWHILALLTIVFWGSTFVCTKVLLQGFTAVQLLVMRFSIAYIACWAVRPKWIKLRLRDELGFLALGILGDSLYSLLENIALDLSTASNVSILVTISPVFTVILAHLFTRDEKLTGRLIGGSAVALCGVVMVVLNGTLSLKLGAWGDLLAIAAALCWAGYSIVLKAYAGRFDPIVLTRKTLFYGILTALPMMLIEGKPFDIGLLARPDMLISILVLGLLGSCLCFILWNLAIKRLGVVMTTNYLYLIPFVTVAVAAVVLGEQITWMAVIGAVLIIAGVVLCSGDIKLPWNHKKPDETASCTAPEDAQQ